jgi:uncharacterized OB-fold protein
MSAMEYTKPLPQIGPDTRAFWEGCRDHKIRIQKCGDCGHLRWPPAFFCPNCLSRNTQLIAASGRGTVYSYVVYHVAYDPSFKQDLPYVVALVELEEGPHLLTNIVECDPNAVFCDMAVETVWDDVTDTVSLPKFRPITR